MEKVYVENEWYDGPRKGVANFNGVAHRFVACYQSEKGYLDSFKIFPISGHELELEIEQWKIFVEWNKQYESGKACLELHPGTGGISQRWDELEYLLRPNREYIPENAVLALAEFVKIDRLYRYESTGPDYGVIWKPV